MNLLVAEAAGGLQTHLEKPGNTWEEKRRQEILKTTVGEQTTLKERSKVKELRLFLFAEVFDGLIGSFHGLFVPDGHED